jgi:protein ExsB|nr:MAG TPA: putative PP-loop superfamily ATPase [Caudoviricetes sp.]
MKTLVLLSGGIDSTTCLAMSVRAYGPENVEAVSFSYGQKHVKELECAKAIAQHYGIKHTVLNVDSQVFASSSSTLIQGHGEMNHGKTYAEIQAESPGEVDTYVPFRNGLMLSQAAALAYSIGAYKIIYGAHSDDAAGGAYPDCTTEFYEAMDEAIFQGTGQKVRLDAPLLTLNKAQVVKQGLAMNTPYHLTRSCYEGEGPSCGTCATCLDRLEAFKINNITDPIPYK